MKLISTLTTASLVLVSGIASATPTFPGIVEETVGAKSAPACTICHATPSGGLGTATKPFAIYLKSRGLVPNDETSLTNALAAATGEKHDSDGDGISDVDQLRAGLDPNGTSADAPELPQYGCGNVSGRGGDFFGGLVLVALLALSRKAGEQLA